MDWKKNNIFGFRGKGVVVHKLQSVPSGAGTFPSSLGPLYRNEVKSSNFDMEMIFHFYANTINFHMKGSALGLILKVRVFGIRKSPIAKFATLDRGNRVNFRKDFRDCF